MAADNGNDIGNNRLYKISENISWFFLTTLWFNLSFIPLFIFFFFVEATLANVVWYLIGMIPLGPAIGALLGSTINVIEEDDFSEPGRDFRRFYKMNFLDSLKVWVPYLVLLYVISVNINYYFNIVSGQLVVLGYVFALFAIILTLYMIPVLMIQTKFSFRYKDMLKLAAYYFFTKLKLSFGNLFIMFIVTFLLLMISEWILLAIPALLAYIWMLYNYSIVKNVKNNFVKQEE